MDKSRIAAIVLAAGRGTRMQSNIPKVLHKIQGTSMIQITLGKLIKLNLGHIVIVVGHRAEQVKKEIGEGYLFEFQKNQNGTGDAVKSGIRSLSDFETVLVVDGDDSAFYSVETLEKFIKFHGQATSVITVMTQYQPQDTVIGRMIKNEKGNFIVTLEDKEYRESGFYSDEANCGAYLFNLAWLRDNVDKINPAKSNGEVRITELLNIAHVQGKRITFFRLPNASEWFGVNTQEELQKANELFKQK